MIFVIPTGLTQQWYVRPAKCRTGCHRFAAARQLEDVASVNTETESWRVLVVGDRWKKRLDVSLIKRHTEPFFWRNSCDLLPVPERVRTIEDHAV